MGCVSETTDAQAAIEAPPSAQHPAKKEENAAGLDAADIESDDDAEFFASLDETSWHMLDSAASQSLEPTSSQVGPCEGKPDPDEAPAEPAPAAMPAFQRANGKRFSRPSDTAMQQAAKRLRLDEADTAEPPIARARMEAAQAKRPRVSGARDTVDQASVPPPASQPLGASTQGNLPSATQYGAFSQKPTSCARSPPPATPDRTQTLSRIRRSPFVHTPGNRPARTLGDSPLRKPLSLGITPRTQRSGIGAGTPSRATFVTPFRKDRGLRAAPAAGSPSGGKAPPPRTVFDLTSSGPRHSLADEGLTPHALTWESARSQGVPLEACVVLNDPPSAAQYHFAGAEGRPLGTAQACAALQQAGCRAVSSKWVQNHWHMLLWKFAAQAAARPQLARTYWSWDRMLSQLRYRYEREVHRHEHSVVKRIQEHTASAARPMVLCVHQVLRFEDPESAADGATVMLELSDGWYRIRAELDAPLRRAVAARRIRRGHKLGIAGARLNSLDDGTPVLDALNTSDLRLSANSTALARWDARMGFQRTPFVSSLRRVMSDGGSIAAMDICLDRIYPIGFVEGRPDARGNPVPTGPEHGVEEEEERRATWNRRRLAAREQLAQSAARLERVIAVLEAHVLPCEPLDTNMTKGASGGAAGPS